MRLGLCFPPRPRPGEPDFAAPELWGCLHREIQGPLLERLRDDARIKTVVPLDFRRALVESGALVVDGVVVHTAVDALFWYCEIDRRPGSFHLEALKTLARRVPVFPDPWQWEVAMDKFRAHLALADAGVRVPEFLLCDVQTRELSALCRQLEPLLERWGAAVLKPRRGAWGHGVMLIEGTTALRDLIGYVRATTGTSPDGGFFLEQYLDNDLDRWLSATMLGTAVVYGYRKRSGKHVPLGGRSDRMKVFDASAAGGDVALQPLTSAHVQAAQAAARALGCPIIGFDMIWTADGPVIVDENTSPGTYADLYAAVGLDPALAWAEMICTLVGLSTPHPRTI